MACCGGGNRVATSMQGYTPPVTPYVSDEVFVVTFPDGRTQEFDQERDAYRALRLTGGGISRKPKG